MAGELALWDITTTKDESASSTAQIPTTATVKVYREGAWVNGAQNNLTGAGVSITVHDIGGIRVSDVLYKFDETDQTDGLDSVSMTVTSITDQDTIVATIGGTVSLADADRLIISNARPATYTDDRGVEATSVASQVSTNSDTGYGFFYIADRNFDVIVLVASSNSTLLTDQHGGIVSHEVSLAEEGVTFIGFDDVGGTPDESDASANVTAMQQAFDQVGRDAGSGVAGYPVSSLISMRGTAYIDEDIVIDNGGTDFISLSGEPGSVIKAKSGFSDTALFTVGTSGSHKTLWIKNQEFDGNNIAGLDVLGASQGYENVVIENCWFYNFDGQGLVLGEANGGLSGALRYFHINGNRFEDFASATSTDACIKIANGVWGEISGNIFRTITNRCIDIQPPSVTDYVRQLSITDNHISSDAATARDGIYIIGQATDETTTDPQQSFGVVIRGNTIEGTNSATDRAIYVKDCQHVTIDGNHIVAPSASNDGIFVFGCRSVVISNNNVDGGAGSCTYGIVASTSNEVSVSGNLVYDTNWAGIVSATCTGITIAGNNVHDCNVADVSANGAGILVTGNPDRVTISGNQSVRNLGSGGTNGHGVKFTGTATNVLIVGNNFDDNVTAGITLGTTTDVTYGLNIES